MLRQKSSRKPPRLRAVSLSRRRREEIAKVKPSWGVTVKWIIFAIGLAFILPAAQWLRQNPRHVPVAWMLFGFLPFSYNPRISLIDWSGWPGYVLGVQITGIDLLSLILFLVLPPARRPAPFRVVMILYFVAVTVSVFQAEVAMAAAFYPLQLLRIYFVYIVVRRASSDVGTLDRILTGMAAGLCLQVALAAWQKAQGVVQPGGSFADKNLLGLISEFAIFVPFALMMAGKRGWQFNVAPVAGAVIGVLTASRAAVGLAAIGFVAVFLLSSLRGWTTRKARVLLGGLLAVAVLTPIAVTSFEKRFAQERVGGADERAMFNNVTTMILADHPFGIGANNYVVVANSGGYSERAGIPWTSALAIAHNIYGLTAAETGYPGVIAFLLLWFRVIIVSFRCAWMYTKDIRGDMLLGLGVTLLVVGIHNAYEWVFMIYNVQYLFGITAGLIAGLAEQLGYWRAGQRVPVAFNSNMHGRV